MAGLISIPVMTMMMTMMMYSLTMSVVWQGYLEKGSRHTFGARPVYLIMTIIKWTPTIRLSMTKSVSVG